MHEVLFHSKEEETDGQFCNWQIIDLDLGQIQV